MKKTAPRQGFLLHALALASLLACGSVAAQQNTTYNYQYDAVGNLTKIIDPLGRTTDQQYDALNRLVLQQQPAPQAGSPRPVIGYGYDGLDQLTSVTDPRNLVTGYTIDGLGNQTRLTSPDTGATSKTYDAAGNVLTSTDAKGQTTTYQYDLLNRVKSIAYADGNIVNYQYDQGPNALGRLSQISDANGSIAYGYDQKGRITTEIRTIAGTPYTTGYQYNPAGQLTSVTYPSGRTLTYTRDALGRIAQIDTTRDGVTTPLISQVTYHPFGGVKSFMNGAGKTVTRGIDLDGRTNSYTLGSQTYSVGYDAASRINFLTDVANPANTQNYGYDDLDRLINYSGTGANQSIGYDATGNRTNKLVGTSNTSYGINPASNQITQLTGSQNASIITDPNGSIVNNGANQFTYDARGRMTGATTVLGNAQYTINALGQRIAKTVQGTTTVFHYDLSGKLIAESNNQGQVQKEYIYLGDLPVALLK